MSETYLQLADGSIIGSANPMPMSGTNVYSTDVAVHDGAQVTQHLHVDPDGHVFTGGEPTLNTGQQVTGTSGARALLLAQNTHRRNVILTNLSGHTVFIGGSAVAIGTGHAVLTLTSTPPLETTAAIYIVSSNTGDTMSYAEVTT